MAYAGQSLAKIDRKNRILGQSVRHLIKEIRLWLDTIETAGKAEELKARLGSLANVKGNLTKISNIIGASNREFGAREIKMDLLNKYVEAIKEIPVPVVSTSSNQKGEIGEWMTPWVVDFMAYNSQKKAAEMVQTLIDSGKTSQLGKQSIQMSYISSNNGIKEMLESNNKLENITAKGESVTIETRNYTSKADAVFKMHNNGLEDIEFPSVKNYSSFKDITIVDNTTLNRILERSLDPAWAAHYVNTMIAHGDEGTTGANFLSSFRIEAQKSFNALAMYIGLIGYTSTNAASLFIVFNSKAKKVKVFDTYLLLGELLNVQNASNAFSIKTNNGTGTVNLSSGDLLPQNFAVNWQRRIDNIEHYLHSHKIHIAISLKES